MTLLASNGRIRLITAVAFLLGTTVTTLAQQQLSPEQRARAQAAMQACRPDYRSFCSDMQPGGGRILACLRAQDPKRLSSACRDMLARANAR